PRRGDRASFARTTRSLRRRAERGDRQGAAMTDVLERGADSESKRGADSQSAHVGPTSLIFEYSKRGRRGYQLPALDVPIAEALPANLRRTEVADEVEVSEVDVIRHFTR